MYKDEKELFDTVIQYYPGFCYQNEFESLKEAIKKVNSNSYYAEKILKTLSDTYNTIGLNLYNEAINIISNDNPVFYATYLSKCKFIHSGEMLYNNTEDFKMTRFSDHLRIGNDYEYDLDESHINSGPKFNSYYFPIKYDENALRIIQKSNINSIFQNEGLRLYLKHLWNEIFYCEFLFYLIYTILLFTSNLLFGTTFVTKESLLFSYIDYIGYVCLILNSTKIVFEIIEMIQDILRQGIYEQTYFSDFWNVIDLVTGISSIMMVIMYQLYNASDATRLIGIISVLSSFLVLLKVMRGFEKVSYLVKSLINNYYDMREFLLVIVLTITTFAVTFILVFKKTYVDLNNVESPSQYDPSQYDHSQYELGERIDQFSNFLKSWLSTMKLALGDFDVSYLEDTINQEVAILLFILEIVILPVIMMNLLIAILSDSYEKTQENSTIYMYKERTDLILNMTFLMTTERKSKIFKSGYLKYILAKGYQLDEDYDDINRKEIEYEGFVKGIKNEIKINFKESKNDINNLKNDIYNLKNDIKHENKELKHENKELKHENKELKHDIKELKQMMIDLKNLILKDKFEVNTINTQFTINDEEDFNRNL